MKHLRKIAGKTKWDHIRNETIRTEIKQTPILERIKEKKLTVVRTCHKNE